MVVSQSFPVGQQLHVIIIHVLQTQSLNWSRGQSFYLITDACCWMNTVLTCYVACIMRLVLYYSLSVSL